MGQRVGETAVWPKVFNDKLAKFLLQTAKSKSFELSTFNICIFLSKLQVLLYICIFK